MLLLLGHSIEVGGTVSFHVQMGTAGDMVPFQSQVGTVVEGMVPFQAQVGKVVVDMVVEVVDIGDQWGTEEADSLVENPDSILLDTWKTR